MTIKECISDDNCTACGACINICPKSCISFKLDEFKCFQTVIEKKKCIDCSKCIKSCHLLNNNIFYNKSDDVFVAWSKSKEKRENSASGGLATEFYSWGLKNNFDCYGVKYTRSKGAIYIQLKSIEDLKEIRNSKYVFSDMGDLYLEIKEKLDNGKKVLFIGLPCQVASLKTFLKRTYQHLVLIDIICHGVAPNEYLEEHLKYLEIKKKKNIKTLFFRDPKFGTQNYIFSCKDSRGNYIYKKGVYEEDVYQIGYHKSLIYRENCYNCKYARPERVGDLTIGDFSGLGRKEVYSHKKENVSCVIVSNNLGKELIEELKLKNRIEMFRRPPEEAYHYERQLIGPSIKHSKRENFRRLLKENGSFEYSVKKVLIYIRIRNKLKKILFWNTIKNSLLKIIPKKIKYQIKRYLKGV